MKRLAIILLAFGSAVWASSNEKEEMYRYQTQGVALRGFLTLSTNVEADGTEVHPYILMLSRPISVAPKDKSSAERFETPQSEIKELQVVPSESVDLQPLVGQTVLVKGVLMGASSSHHFRSVLLNATSIEPMNVHRDTRLPSPNNR